MAGNPAAGFPALSRLFSTTFERLGEGEDVRDAQDVGDEQDEERHQDDRERVGAAGRLSICPASCATSSSLIAATRAFTSAGFTPFAWSWAWTSLRSTNVWTR